MDSAVEAARLPEKLRVTTKQMANRCTVDLVLWGVHSNACLDAATEIERLQSQVERMREALEACGHQLEFYAREHAVKTDRALSAGKLDEARASSAKAKVNTEFAARARAALLSSSKTEEGPLTADEVMREVYDVASDLVRPVLRDAYEGRGRFPEDKGKVPAVVLRDLGLEPVTTYRRKVLRDEAPVRLRRAALSPPPKGVAT